MVITHIRFAFIEVETHADALAAVAAPQIPLAFLLNEAAYQAQLADAVMVKGAYRMPWYDDFGKLFWYYFLERKSEFWVTFNEAWRGLVPLLQPNLGEADANWLDDGEIDVRGHLYPWGVAAIIDVHARGRWTLAKAVELALQARTSGTYQWTAAGKTSSLTMNALMSHVLTTLREHAHGAKAAAGKAREMCTAVTVLDAEKAPDDVPVKDQGPLHRGLDAFVSFSPHWKKTPLVAITDRAIRLKQVLAPPGHILYGGRRGRAVWFPAGFPSSSAEPKGSPHCYHQNLAASMLHTESLCALVQSAAARLAAGQTIGAQSVTYQNCVRLAAGIIGRLHGGNAGTYKSRSVRSHIQDDYLGDLNAVRKSLKLTELQFAPVNQ
jgi:hypothetical protein